MAGERKEIDLNGQWRFCPDPSCEGETRGYPLPSYDASRWPLVDVPSVFESAAPELDNYYGVCWYRRNITLGAIPDHMRALLMFGAVNYRVRVYVNGVEAGWHCDGFLPFQIDLTDHIESDGRACLAVEVDNRHVSEDVPGNHVGWRGSGGIIGPVRVCICHRVRIKSCTVAAGSDGRFIVNATVENATTSPASPEVGISIADSSGHRLYDATTSITNVPESGGAEVSFSGTLDEPLLWSPDSPTLYSLTATAHLDGVPTDQYTTTFGFRTVVATPQGILLNGAKVFLKGFNRHADSPTSGMAVDKETTASDLRTMKDMGSNCVRLCHYPHDPSELDLCDELGLIAFCEIPLYFWNDEEEGEQYQPQRASAAERQLTAMIARDVNHPSVLFWSVSNETNENIPEVAADNRDLIAKAKELDPTRLCVHVSNHWNEDPNFAADDVMCINGYPSMAWGDLSRESWPDPANAAQWWRDGLEQLRAKFPDKPILVTEFGYVSIAGTFGNRFGEDTHAEVLASEYAGFDAPYVCGALIWCWADHAWPPGRFLGGLSTSPFGVVSRNRAQKLPLSTAKRLFCERRSS